jgi:exo-beta-1,3-glucanase (GH17 family)
MYNHKPPVLWQFTLFNLILLVLLGAWLWQKNQPVIVPDAILPVDAAAKVQCVSYAPYYGKDQTPFKIGTHITQSQIDADLERIAKVSNCVRIYSVGQGLDYVPAAAQKLGLKVLVGAWIGWTAADNNKEINLATALANQYPNTVKAVIVGNEVLLRGEQAEEAMQAYIARAKQLTKVPVTYADVWEFWLNHRNLEQSVDFVTIHLLPYWENNPQSVEQSIQHANIVMNKLDTAFSKPILIGETGWPSTGRQRGTSIPSALNQARYIRTFLREAEQKHWQYNLIEAFDQPWKRELEGAVGGFWGIYDTELSPKFNLTGPVFDRHDGIMPVLFAAIGAFILCAVTFVVGQKHVPSYIGMAILGALAGVTSLLQLEYLGALCGDGSLFGALSCVPTAGRPLASVIMGLQWLSMGGAVLAAWLMLLSLPVLIYQQSAQAVRFVKLMVVLLLVGALAIGLLLTVDGRYRDFPVMIYALPVLQFSLGLWLAKTPLRFTNPVALVLGVGALTTALVCYLIEPLNYNAAYWLGVLVLFTVPLLFKKQ